MATIKLPRIAEQNYEAVRSLLKKGVPATYAEWLDLRAKWFKQYAGDTVVSVEIDPKKLTAFFDTARHTHELRTLFDFIDSVDSQ